MDLKLSVKEVEIILLLYRFRFLSSKFIQEILGHKSHRRINYWLSSLSKQQLVGRRFNKATRANIYFLLSNSAQVLKEQKQIKNLKLDNIYREHKRTDTFIEHSLFVADVYSTFLKLTRLKNMEIKFYSKVDLSQFKFFPQPLPDGYFTVKGKDNDTRQFFLEVFDKTLPHSVVQNKIRKYFDYSSEGEWKEATGRKFPEILIICGSKRLNDFTSKFIAETLKEEYEKLDFYVIGDREDSKSEESSIWQKFTKITSA